MNQGNITQKLLLMGNFLLMTDKQGERLKILSIKLKKMLLLMEDIITKPPEVMYQLLIWAEVVIA